MSKEDTLMEQLMELVLQIDKEIKARAASPVQLELAKRALIEARDSLYYPTHSSPTNPVDTITNTEGENTSTEGRLAPQQVELTKQDKAELPYLMRKTFSSIVHVPSLTDEEKEKIK